MSKNVIAVGIAATEVSPARSTRTWISLVNESDATIYVGYDGSGDALTVANGHPIPSGEYIVLKNDGPTRAFTGKIEAIHGGAGTKDLRVQEV